MKLPKWLAESNRWKHLVGCIILTYCSNIFVTIGCMGGMEFKDVHHANGNKPMREWDWSAWDWLDIAAGAIGAVIGQALQILTIWLVWIMVKNGCKA